MKRNLIILSGRKQVGKDTFAQFFVNNGFHKFAFADNMKLSLRKFLKDQFCCDVEIECFYDNYKKENLNLVLPFTDKEHYTIRELMQWYGQTIKKNFGEDYWVKRTVYDILSSEYTNVVITDARYKIELDCTSLLLRDFKISKILITRNTGFLDAHSSEEGLSEKYFDYVINNDSDVQNLENQFKDVFFKIGI